MKRKSRRGGQDPPSGFSNESPLANSSALSTVLPMRSNADGVPEEDEEANKAATEAADEAEEAADEADKTAEDANKAAKEAEEAAKKAEKNANAADAAATKAVEASGGTRRRANKGARKGIKKTLTDQHHRQTIRHNCNHEDPPPKREQRCLLVLGSKRANPPLSAKDDCRLGIEKRCHQKEVDSNHRDARRFCIHCLFRRRVFLRGVRGSKKTAM